MGSASRGKIKGEDGYFWTGSILFTSPEGMRCLPWALLKYRKVHQATLSLQKLVCIIQIYNSANLNPKYLDKFLVGGGSHMNSSLTILVRSPSRSIAGRNLIYNHIGTCLWKERFWGFFLPVVPGYRFSGSIRPCFIPNPTNGAILCEEVALNSKWLTV